MGKRGPPPTGDYNHQTKTFSTRIEPATLDALKSEAKKNKRSLSQEINNRLNYTLTLDEKDAAAFGSIRNAKVMRVIAHVLDSVRNPDHPEVDWLDDPVAFHQAMRAVGATLEIIAPEGSRELSKGQSALSWKPVIDAQNIWTEIANANPSLPLTAPAHLRFANAMRSALPELAARITTRHERAEADRAKRMAAVQKSRSKKS